MSEPEVKICWMFRATALQPPLPDRPRGTLSVCKKEGGWFVIFDKNDGERHSFETLGISWMDEEFRPVALPEVDNGECRDLGTVKYVGLMEDFEPGQFPGFELRSRLPVTANKITTAIATGVQVRPSGRPG